MSQVQIRGAQERGSGDTFQFNIAGISIPTMTEKPVKILSKAFNSTVQQWTDQGCLENVKLGLISL